MRLAILSTHSIPTARSSRCEATHGGNVLYREEILLRDELGRIVDRRETLGGVATDSHYDYDALGRLWKVSVNGVLQTEYGYDLDGNRLTKTAGAVTTGSNYDQDRIQTWGTLGFSHTANGERLTRTDTATSQTTTYTSDALGNLTGAVLPGDPTRPAARSPERFSARTTSLLPAAARCRCRGWGAACRRSRCGASGRRG
jgi:YD repeat-containing protein